MQVISLFTVYMPDGYIWSIDMALSGATAPDQSGPEGDANEGVFHIAQIPKDRATLSDGFVSYAGHSFGWRSYPSAEMPSMYSTAPDD